MNLLVIGKDVDDIALDIGKNSQTSYVVKSQTLAHVEDVSLIQIIDSDVVLEKYTINDVIDFCEKKNYAVSIISTDKKEEIIYYNLEERLPRVVLWERNENKKDYEEFIDYCVDSLKYDYSL